MKVRVHPAETDSMARNNWAATALLLTALVGCQQQTPETINEIDGELVNGVDGNALGDQIIVDPALTMRKGGAVRSAETGAAAPGAKTCPNDVEPGTAWAGKLPAYAPLPQGATVREAAGTDRAGCGLRVVTFTTQAAAEPILAFYEGKARAAGFTTERESRAAETVLGGTRGENAYLVTVRGQAGGGSEVDLVASVGR